MRQALRSVPELILKKEPPDYTETLGAIANNFEIVGQFHGVDRAARACRDDRIDVRHRTAMGMVGLDRQRRVFLGLLIPPLVARVLPFGWDGQIAAVIMNADCWDAGSALMTAQNPEAWRVLMDAGK